MRLLPTPSSRWLEPLLIVISILATRIPHLAHPDLMLDADECIVALMAKHWWENGEI